MSLASWIEEFYPTEADQVPDSEAIAHSLRKWKGLRFANLAKHDGEKDGVVISFSDGHFMIDLDSCALCQCFLNEGLHGNAACEDCPLAVVRRGTPCDDLMDGESTSPFLHWIDCGDPKPMIKWLELALEQANA